MSTVNTKANKAIILWHRTQTRDRRLECEAKRNRVTAAGKTASPKVLYIISGGSEQREKTKFVLSERHTARKSERELIKFAMHYTILCRRVVPPEKWWVLAIPTNCLHLETVLNWTLIPHKTMVNLNDLMGKKH